MTKLIRHAVSGKNRRYIDEDFDLDLDLTYITPRIVAMGYPSTGIESSYRNPAKEVSSLLERKHSGHYTVFNLTDRTYDSSIFPTGEVFNFPFPDHHAPPFSLLIEILKKMDEIYKSEDESVLVLHCLAGHGRTGTVISAFLLYEDMCQSPEEALQFFARTRSYKDKGVSHPSQKRAVYYAYTYKQMMLSSDKDIFTTPQKIKRVIEKIIFQNLFFENSSKNVQSIILVLLNSKFEVIYDSSSLNTKINKASADNSKGNANTNDKKPPPITYNKTEICFNIRMPVEDDITLKVYKVPKLMIMQSQRKEVFRISFNMLFCNNYGVAFPKWDIDGPHKDINNEKFPSKMCVCVEMEPTSGRKKPIGRLKINDVQDSANDDNDNDNPNNSNNTESNDDSNGNGDSGDNDNNNKIEVVNNNNNNDNDVSEDDNNNSNKDSNEVDNNVVVSNEIDENAVDDKMIDNNVIDNNLDNNVSEDNNVIEDNNANSNTINDNANQVADNDDEDTEKNEE